MRSSGGVFRCDYCGQFAPLSAVTAQFTRDYVRADGSVVFTISMTCGAFCAQSAGEMRVGGR